MFDRLTGLAAAAILLSSHFHIHFSRIGLNNIWDGLFVVLLLAALWHGWRSGQRRSFILAGLFLGLGLYFYVTFRMMPLLLLIWGGVALLWPGTAVRQRLPDLIVTAYIAAILFMPLGLFFAYQPDEFRAPLNRVTIFDGWLEREVEIVQQPAVEIVARQMAKTALGFTHEPLRHWYNPGTPLLLAAAAALFLMGLVWAVIHLDLRYLLLLLPLAAMVVLGGLSQDAPASQRYVMVMPLVALLVALPLGQVAGWLQQLWPRQRPIWSTAVALIVGWLMLTDGYYYFFKVYDNYILGGINTLVATEVAHFLQEQPEPAPMVYFFGWPRMGYYSLSTIPYLAPQVQAQDVAAPLTVAPNWALGRPTYFIFLPERSSELVFVQASYPHGRLQDVVDENGQILFVVYSLAAGTGPESGN
jgi:4-amino-4-deoxy-L-arabinose transferase-like glycosyltransferase